MRPRVRSALIEMGIELCGFTTLPASWYLPRSGRYAMNLQNTSQSLRVGLIPPCGPVLLTLHRGRGMHSITYLQRNSSGGAIKSLSLLPATLPRQPKSKLFVNGT